MRKVILAFGVLTLAGCAAADSTVDAAQEVADARSGFVETPDGERIHYLEVGPEANRGLGAGNPASGGRAPASAEGESGAADDGRPALLFVPGWSLSAEIWEPQLEHFGETHRTVAMDPRAQGRSSKPRENLHAAARAGDIRAVVETLELEPVVLVGWSMGVTEAVAYVDRFGTEGLAALALVDGVAGVDLEESMAVSYLRYLADWVHDRPGATEEFVRGLFNSDRSEDYVEAVIERALRTPTDAAVALVAGLARNDYRDALSRIDRPTLVAIASGSPWDAEYEAMHAAIPEARLERFEGAGHALFVDRPERFNTALEELLAEAAVAAR